MMIPMRDGIKLHTVIIAPVEAKQSLPILIQRTPYGADPGFANDSAIGVGMFGRGLGRMLEEGYYLVIQDIRGKYKKRRQHANTPATDSP